MTADVSDPFEEPRDLGEEDTSFAEASDDPGIAAAEEAAEATGAAVDPLVEESVDTMVEETGDTLVDETSETLVEETGELPAEADLLETYEEFDGEAEEPEPGP